MTQFCFANPTQLQAEDVAIEVTEGVYLGQYSRMSLEQLQARDPGIQLLNSEEFLRSCDLRMTTDPKEVEESRYWYLLEVLPPCSWHRDYGCQSFYMSEFISGNVTSHVVMLDKRYFTFDAPVMKYHSDRVAKVREWLDKQPVFTGEEA
jgi:hypothetical protein